VFLGDHSREFIGVFDEELSHVNKTLVRWESVELRQPSAAVRAIATTSSTSFASAIGTCA